MTARTEGWFAAPGGSFVTTEPVGTEDWMPLNDYPTAKPTYDFYDTVNAGKTALANGKPKSVTHHGPAPVPGRFGHLPLALGRTGGQLPGRGQRRQLHLTSRRASDGLLYYEAQDSSISAKQQAANLAIMNQQQDITDFESQFNGPFPFSSDGVVVGAPAASFEEEMQTMITFAGGEIDLDTLYHENMHQWWGDNVTEGSYPMTFYKEGLATLAEYMYAARTAETKAGGPGTAAGRQAFTSSLVAQFNKLYAKTGSFWSTAPSNPTPRAVRRRPDLRPARRGLCRAVADPGHRPVHPRLQTIQREYGGGSITEPELEAAFQRGLPVQSHACHAELSQFFTQWFDTAYPTASGATEPAITGPGLNGPGFSC